MKQKDLCNKIGMADRSFRRLSPAKRKQWQVLADKGRTAAWYDVLAQLCFTVDAFNSPSFDNEWVWLQACGPLSSITHFKNGKSFRCIEIYSHEQLTEALQYVQSLNK
jgi:hypothetical protein